MKAEVQEILDYMRVTTQENTTKEQFHADMEKYELPDILEAVTLLRAEPERPPINERGVPYNSPRRRKVRR